MKLQRPDWDKVGRAVRGAIIVGLLTMIAAEVWQGAIGLTTRTGIEAKINQTEHPIFFWVLVVGLGWFLLDALYRLIVDERPKP